MTKRLLFLACAVLLLESFFSAVLTPLVPSYRRELGLTDGATGVLVAAYAAGSLLCALPAGWFASRFNPRKAVILGLIGVGLSSALFGFAGHVGWLEASRFFLGAFGTLLWAGGLSWVISSSPVAKRGQVMGTLLAAAVAGELAGAPVGALADEVGTEKVFGGTLLVSLLLIALARTVPAAAEADGQTARQATLAIKQSGIRAWLLALLAVIGPSIALGFILLIAPLRFDDLGPGRGLPADVSCRDGRRSHRRARQRPHRPVAALRHRPRDHGHLPGPDCLGTRGLDARRIARSVCGGFGFRIHDVADHGHRSGCAGNSAPTLAPSPAAAGSSPLPR